LGIMPKRAVVTGASSGIGAALAVRLLSSGWSVAMVARSVDKMQALATVFPSEKVKIIGADLSVPSQCEEICKEIRKWCDDKLDLLVNNAGAGIFDQYLDTTDIEAWNACINLNLTSCFLLTKHLKPALVNAAPSSSVVNIGSIGGFRAFPKLTPYCVAKAGVAHLTRCNAMELAPQKVRVNCVQPATVVTNFHERALGKEHVKKYYEDSQALHPIGRAGNVNDVVQMILFLADVEKAGWITGQCITLDGGRTLVTSIPSKSNL